MKTLIVLLLLSTTVSAFGMTMKDVYVSKGMCSMNKSGGIAVFDFANSKSKESIIALVPSSLCHIMMDKSQELVEVNFETFGGVIYLQSLSFIEFDELVKYSENNLEMVSAEKRDKLFNSLNMN